MIAFKAFWCGLGNRSEELLDFEPLVESVTIVASVELKFGRFRIEWDASKFICFISNEYNFD